jgi:hypothetical protein
MDIETLLNIPPWEWPKDAGKIFEKALTDKQAKESDRLIAAELAGDLVVMNNRLADGLMLVLRSAAEPEVLRAKAAVSFGPVLEESDTSGFDDPEDVPISERTFRKIQDLLEKLYFDESVPKEVRRRILEASVRAPEEWHSKAISAAYSSGDREWMLTAVFSMRWVRGFDDQILEALENPDPEIHYEAVLAAGNGELEAAWPHMVALIEDARTPKPLLIAAINAVSTIRPHEARSVLEDLTDSDDEDIADAAQEAIGMAEAMSGLGGEEEDADDWIN